jgi:predicted membrane channel-forming protein YqfA (hemolysin III family)
MSSAWDVIRAVLGIMVAAFAIWMTVKLFNKQRKFGRRFWIFTGVLYCASVGPMGRIAQETGSEWIMYAYFPIMLLGHEFRPLAELVFFYLGLCGVKIG